ncbi:MAG: GNAT family N-acetyltransferase [Anaerolineae bacterium]|nr:GNAT family N-acetyltransferase [Anaerolineae bacterium]
MMVVEPSLAQDLEQILDISREVGVFSDEEVDTVDELFQGYLSDAVKSGYNFLSCREDGKILGFACWGPTALTMGTIDLYWICTDKNAQGRGVAARLFKAVEDYARQAGRWLIVIWTSSKLEYEAARRFYLKMGCKLTTQIADFYDHGDDLCVFIRRLDADDSVNG